MVSFHVWTVGCQMNKADSERLQGGLEQLGLTPCDEPERADVVVLNTCVVRQSAEDTATGMLGRLRRAKRDRPGQVVAVMGCMVGPTHDDLRRRFPHVDVWARPQQFSPVIEAAAIKAGVDPGGCLNGLVPEAPHITSYVPIVHGCDKFCTFCIIPYRRGREKSRPVDELIHEVTVMSERGVREVTLLGQNVDSYGHDLRPRRDLADLLEAVSEVDGIERVRFLTSHPNDMSPRIIQAVAELPKVCENVNLPFQAGSDRILAEMRRGYTSDQYLEKVQEVRETIPGVTITTDLIVGFPGETAADFEDSLRILDSVKFDKVHAASYSERDGTYASRRMPDTVDREEKKRRIQAVSASQERIQASINADLLGREFDILIDGRARDRMHGRTRGDKLVYVTSGNPTPGDTVRVKVESASPWSLEGALRVVEREKVPVA